MAEAVGADPVGFREKWTYETYTDRAVGTYATIEDNIDEICRLLDIAPAREAIARAAKIRCRFAELSLAPRPDAAACLKTLREMRLKLGLVSDCSAEVPMLWPRTPLAALLDTAVFSCTAGVKKPNPAIYRKACSELNVTPGSCYYVGDGSSEELSGAQVLGMHAVLLELPPGERSPVLASEADTWQGDRVRSLAEAAELIAGELGAEAPAQT
jgi:putative hydrolase of the HAD superfamily